MYIVVRGIPASTTEDEIEEELKQKGYDSHLIIH
nr:unnamed protein product [Callosobruchus analis]